MEAAIQNQTDYAYSLNEQLINALAQIPKPKRKYTKKTITTLPKRKYTKKIK